MRILLLEDDNERLIWFLPRFGSNKVFVCKTAEDAVTVLKSNTFDMIFLDHDLCNDHYAAYSSGFTFSEYEAYCKKHLDSTTGMAVAKYISEHSECSSNAQIFIHTMNQWAGKRMARKLLNRNTRIINFDYLQRKGLHGLSSSV